MALELLRRLSIVGLAEVKRISMLIQSMLSVCARSIANAF